MKKISIILIAVRLNSSRLKNKSILNLYNKPLIIQLTERLQKSKLSSNIIWCTSTNKLDDELENLAKKNNINIFRGSELDVMSRFIEVGKQYNAKNIVRVTGDNPLTDPEVIDFLINQHDTNDSEYTCCNSIPIGTRSEIISFDMLQRCYELIQDPESTEYMTWMLNRPDYFKIQDIKFPNPKINRPEISLTIDDEDDFKNIQRIYNYFKNEIPSLETIIDWIDNNPVSFREFVKIKKRTTKNLRKINFLFKNEK